MFEALERVKIQDAANQRARDLAAKWLVLTSEKESAERLVKSIEETMSRPDQDSELLMSIIEAAGKVDSRFTTSGGGFNIGVPGGMIVASVIREAAGQALSQAKRIRASFETRLPEARLRLDEAGRAVDKFIRDHGAEIESLDNVTR